MSDVWTDAQVARLKELWPKGYSASQIAADIGGAITRSAVLGKIFRLNLGGKGGAQQPRKAAPATQTVAEKKSSPPKKPTRLVPMQPRSNTIGDRIALAKEDPGLPPRLEEPAVGSGIQIDALTNCTCRWPFGTPGTADFYYCGAVGADFKNRRSYCEFHTRKAAQKVVVDRKVFEKSALAAAAGVRLKPRGAQHGKAN